MWLCIGQPMPRELRWSILASTGVWREQGTGGVEIREVFQARRRVVLGADGEWEAGLRPNNMADPYPLPLWLLVSLWFCTASRGGTEACRPIEATAALPRGKKKVFPSLQLCSSSPKHALFTAQATTACLFQQKLGLH